MYWQLDWIGIGSVGRLRNEIPITGKLRTNMTRPQHGVSSGQVGLLRERRVKEQYVDENARD